MAVRESEKYIPAPLQPGDLGQAVEQALPGGGVYALVSYLTSPVRTETVLDYVLFALGDAPADEYAWRVATLPGASIVHQTTSKIGIFNWVAELPGTYLVTVDVLEDDDIKARLSLTQEAKPSNPLLETHLDKFRGKGVVGTPYDAMRELVNDLMGYMVPVVAATGPNGIPMRLLAAVLYMEIYGRPKEGTAGAVNLRRMLGSQSVWNWWPRLAAGNPFADPDAKQFDQIRDVEIELVAEFLDEFNPFARAYMGGKSLGVGQIGQATTAMALGDITWRDAPKDKQLRNQTREVVVNDYNDLTFRKKVDIFNRLRFPKTNVAVAATLLTKLKNRLHRWPSLTPAALGADLHAVAIIATEYNMGPSATPRAEAKPNGNGRRAAVKPGYVKDGGFLAPDLFFK